MNIKTASSLVLLATLLAASVARADTPVYKWVDEQGKVHYSTEPHGDKAQQLAIQNSATPHAGTDVTPVPGASTNSAANDAALLQPQPADTLQCKASRDRLSQYLHADTLYSQDDKGNKTPLSDTDRQKALDAARASVKQTCGGGA
jgi:hypothetical protein